MIKKDKQIINVAILVAIIFAIAGGGYGLYKIARVNNNVVQDDQNSDDLNTEIVQEEQCEVRRDLDGVCTEEDDEIFTYSVMIDNHVDARPSVGLAKAGLIYETIVESPITRFLAVFSSDDEIDKIGPVRSARPFYIDFASEFNGPYIHVGGSNDALEMLSLYKYDVNEFSRGNYFWRDGNRYQPHNVFSSSDLVNKIVKNSNWEFDDQFDSWIFKADVSEEERQENKIKIDINFKSYDFAVRWEYARESNDYIRGQGGRVHKDQSGDEIRAKNIAIMYTTSRVIDDYGRREVKTIGEGESVVFQDGKAIEGRWRRTNKNSRTRFYSEDGEEVEFNVGTSWIEVVPTHFPEVVY